MTRAIDACTQFKGSTQVPPRQSDVTSSAPIIHNASRKAAMNLDSYDRQHGVLETHTCLRKKEHHTR